MRMLGWSALLLAAFTIAPTAAPPAPAKKPLHIVLVGDSTVTEGSGWGLGFRQWVNDKKAVVTNLAQNGRSSKSYRDEGFWDKAIALKGDVYLIQFGHNDQPGKGPERETDPETTFAQNLGRYVDEVRAIGALPVLVTSLVRRTFDPANPPVLLSTLGPWVDATKRVGADKRIHVIDLYAHSLALCERMGPAETARFNIKKDDGTFDTTHLEANGSLVFASLVVDELRMFVPGMKTVLLDKPRRLPAAATPAPAR